MRTADDDLITRLAQLHAHRDYYAALGTTVTVEADARTFSFAMRDAEAHRDGKFKNKQAPGRRFIATRGHGRLYIDKAARNGEVIESRPWVDISGMNPLIVEAVTVDQGVSVDG